MIELGIPKVMLTVDMPAQRLHAARVEYSQAIEDAMKRGLEEAVEKVDWQAVAKKAATDAIRELVTEEVRRRVKADDVSGGVIAGAVAVAMREVGLD